MRQGAWIGVREGKCCILWSFSEMGRVKKVIAFDLLVSWGHFCSQEYLKQRWCIPKLAVTVCKVSVPQRFHKPLASAKGMENHKKETRVQNTTMNDFHPMITNLSIIPPQTQPASNVLATTKQKLPPLHTLYKQSYNPPSPFNNYCVFF